MKVKTNPFQFRRRGNVVEVWMGEPDHSESEFILAVDASLVDALIAILTAKGGR